MSYNKQFKNDSAKKIWDTHLFGWGLMNKDECPSFCPMTLRRVQQILADKTRHIQSASHVDRNWQRLLPHLHS